ncbi:MAG: hypothetical protein KDA92_14275 [Planctomycetales bacterium]|nr:hypothetical protein [Planctomycetales bacterium]MCA9167596.1 hypothetical protein [Planctomycetales bacterium]
MRVPNTPPFIKTHDFNAWQVKDTLIEFLAGLRLRIHPHKTTVARSHRGVNFLGFHIFPDQVRLSQQSLRRAAARQRWWQREFQEGIKSAADVRAGIHSWLAHADHANSYGIRRALLRRLRLRRSKDES